MEILLIIVILLILSAEFVNGWTDAPNAIATVVATRVIAPRNAIILAVILNIVGTLSGTAVAETIGKGIIDPGKITLIVIASALLGIIVWSSMAARLGIPTSESHALVAGLTGAGLATGGPDALLWSGWQKVLIGLFFSSILGFVLAFGIGKLIKFFFADTNPVKSKKLFNRLQIFSAALMAFNHGLNDGQKFIGVFVMSLAVAGKLPDATKFVVPTWVVILCALVMGLGTSFGGMKIIGMLGEKMARIESWQGFGAELAASSAISGASFLGIPLSTTHTITTSIMGVAASRRLSSVRWNYSTDILLAWVLTFPVCGTIAFLTTLIAKAFFG